MIRTMIVDDEPLAREGLRLLLTGEPDVEIVGYAADGPSAVRHILTLRPDLVLLDVQMPGMNGFEVVEEIASQHLPAIVFVTAWDRFAVKAFEVHALDYLVKPVTAERLRDAIWRIRNRAAGEDAERVAEMIASRQKSGTAARERFAVRDGHHYVLLPVENVDWIAAEANYVRLHAGPRSYLIRGTLSDLEQQLDPSQFARIHRSWIVNVSRVARITPDSHGDFEVVLTTGQKLRMTRTYRERLID